MAVSNEDKQRVFEQFRVSMGAPLRQIELTDDMLCVLLEISIDGRLIKKSVKISP